MTGWRDRLLPPARDPEAPPRARPEGMLYGVDERLPWGLLLGMGLQHALLALVFALYAAIAAQGMGFDARQTVAYVSATVLVMGLATIIQALPWRFGAGMLLVTIPGAGRIPVQVALVLHEGLAATMGATIAGGLLALVMARLIPRLRSLFPPEVIGVVLVMMGVTLVTGGMTRATGLTLAGGALQGTAVLAALATVGCLVGIAVWGGPGLRRVALLAGALAGTLVVALTGGLPAADTLLAMPLVELPVLGLALPLPEFRLVPILVVAITQFITIMDQFGSALTMDRMTDARWRRADMGLAARAVAGLGLAHLLFGLTGTLPGGPASANIGLVHATGIAARRVGLVAGLVLVAAAFLPPVAGLLVLTPAPVVGGILLYTAAYMISSGIELIMARMMNPRRSFTVGLAIVLGSAVMLLPELGRQAPEWLQLSLRSGLTVGAAAAVALNALFRIGIRRQLRQPLDPAREATEAAELLEAGGRLWGVRQETVLRAGHAVGEALEALRAAGLQERVTLAASFDEFFFECRLLYRGTALPLGQGGAPDAEALLQGDDPAALEAGMRRLSGLIIRRLADRSAARQRGAEAELLLVFNH
ncbi:hypothetical protein BKE38_14150 [Pseudoroseomonas deserti]|uniref:Xanthine/uracil/vitamin C permease n=1 Tax=Teichococcus deserti TaxID=1817963 RepID=A0A1V2H1J0_9PROT|nr:solute carrier family 23 protein [Pseudoroseomonas deserti]ONG52601.1 hypothetical protein BKE38_14150 [Pseudoroseomonas deserti]